MSGGEYETDTPLYPPDPEDEDMDAKCPVCGDVFPAREAAVTADEVTKDSDGVVESTTRVYLDTERCAMEVAKKATGLGFEEVDE